MILVPTTRANTPGGGNGTGPNVTVTQKPDGTTVLENGIVSIAIDGSRARLRSMTYTYNNNGEARTTDVLAHDQYYWGGEIFALGDGHYQGSIATDPASNGGNYGDVMCVSDSPKRGIMEIHFSMLRGSPGFYSTGIQTHRAQDDVNGVTAWGVVTRVPPIFNWLSADEWRNFFTGQPTSSGVGIPNSPHEVTVCLNGTRASEMDDKFIYGQDHCEQRAWGWSSVGQNGLNIGIWLMTNMDFSDGGPMKRDVSVYSYNNLNNSILTGELGMGSDGNLGVGEVWTKTCGPFLMYVNNIPSTITDPVKASRALFDDALAQNEAEKLAWPYTWFKNDKFAQASGRGTVEGKMVINDNGNPRASAADLWVGLEEQPITVNGTYDFQKWLKPYQYWVKTNADGSFTFRNVLPGQNYTLYAFGPGAAGTFLSQNQQGGNPPMECDLPTKPFAVTVTPGTTTKLGDVTWTPVRLGATVFELGYPSRKSDKYRHGEDYWFPSKTPKLGFPTPIWGGQMKYPLDFPSGVNYTVGQSRWTTDWNYCLPAIPDLTGAYQAGTGTINFTLAQAPAANAVASLYLGCAGNDGGHIIVKINGTDLDTATGITATPNPLNTTQVKPFTKGTGGFNCPERYADDSSIHCGDHGPFFDERITFPSTMLRAGQNSITLIQNAKDMTCYLMIDYLRLELSGYVPPAPSRVTAWPGQNRVLVGWSVVPGATSYHLLRATSPNGDFQPLGSELVGPVCGGDVSLVTYTDLTAANGTSYYYAVQSINSTGTSANSKASAGVTPLATLPDSVPASPQGFSVRAGHQQVALNWNPIPGASYYQITRSTLYPNGVGGTYPLRTIVRQDAYGETSFTDVGVTDGDLYSYSIQGVNPAGTGQSSPVLAAAPNTAPPASAPESLTGTWVKNRDGDCITLNWSPVPGAVGYVIYRSKGSDDQFNWPEDFKTTLMETTYTDKPNKKIIDKKPGDKNINPGFAYSYQVTAVNTAGVSPPATVHIEAKH